VYASDLTDAQWQLIEHFFAAQTFRKHHPKDLINAIFYINKTGCQWRMLPQGPAGSGGFPPWKTVY
jgi:transposase